MRRRLLDQRWPWITAAAVAALVLLSTFFEVRVDPDVDDRPPGSVDDIAGLRERSDLNVLFILIDTLRADRLGSYGYARDTTPELDRLAASGVRFDRHLSQSSWTKASMASLWTGLYPPRTGITRFDHVIPPDAQMPAELLKQAGFLTTGIYRNGWVAPTFGFDQGFDTYMRPAVQPLSPQVRAANPTLKNRGSDEDAIVAAIEFLRVYGHERWFLYLHLMDVHEYLYDEQSALFGGSYADNYDNAIRRVDDLIGVLMSRLVELGLSTKTLVVIGSDHGEAFRERGEEGHARSLYRESTEVPLILILPFRLEPGIVVGARSQNVDVWPTLLDLIGLETPPGLDGRSLVPDLLAAARGEALPVADRTAFAHLDQTWGQTTSPSRITVSVADATRRYVRSERNGKRVEQLFDAEADPRELQNQVEREPELLERLRERADSELEQTPPWGESPRREVGELELNQLRALGYAIP